MHTRPMTMLMMPRMTSPPGISDAITRSAQPDDITNQKVGKNGLAIRTPDTPLFPFNCSWRLARHVINHPVYTLDAVGNSRGGPRQEVLRQSRPVGGHEVIGFHGSKRYDALVSPCVSHHAHCLHRQQH